MKYLFNTVVAIIVALAISSCTTTEPIAKSVAYKRMYEEKPLTILLMPPINRSTYVDAKEYFHTTLNVPIANAGYYVVPPFLSMEILKKESAYDAELFLETPLQKFGEVFGADLALFTIIHSWDKSAIKSNVTVHVEYIFKLITTNEILYTRNANVTYNASVSTGMSGALGLIADLAASAINTAITQYIDVARACNIHTLGDLPAGKYSPDYNIDGEQPAGLKDFSVVLSKKNIR